MSYVLPKQISHQCVACALLALLQNVRILPEHKAWIGITDEHLYSCREGFILLLYGYSYYNPKRERQR